MKTHLLIIDPQNSFCDPEGELFVTNADNDMKRLAEFISKNDNQITRISVTLDSHNRIHIAHPVWWVDQKGNHPAPFTEITVEDMQTNKWQAANPETGAWSLTYLKNTDSHTIWPYHCLTGTWGHEVYKPLDHRLQSWAEKHMDLSYTMKGGCRFTEHFSAISPSMEVPGDPSTLPNKALITTLAEADTILIAGEASSHCVADTTRDIIRENESLCKKIILLTDTMSPVPGFEQISELFFHDMKKYQVRTSTTDTLYQ